MFKRSAALPRLPCSRTASMLRRWRTSIASLVTPRVIPPAAARTLAQPPQPLFSCRPYHNLRLCPRDNSQFHFYCHLSYRLDFFFKNNAGFRLQGVETMADTMKDAIVPPGRFENNNATPTLER